MLKPTKRTSERIFLIENIAEITINKDVYYLCIFDDATIALFDGVEFKNIIELIIPFDNN
jgi:hypothetical protein